MPVSKLLTFPIGSYLMLRIDYVVICRDELEAKILRIIEMYMEMERARLYQEAVNGSASDTDEEVEITADVWVSISHRLFTRDLYQLVKSENTLKRAIKSLEDKGFIAIRPGTGKHDPMVYQLCTAKIQAEFEKIARLGIVGYQKLIPSKIDTSKSDTREGSKNRHHQTLTPSKIDPHSRITSSSRIGERSNNGEEDNEGESTGANAPDSRAHTSALQENPLDRARRLFNESEFDPETAQFYQNWVRNCEVAREHGIPEPPRPAHMIVVASERAEIAGLHEKIEDTDTRLKAYQAQHGSEPGVEETIRSIGGERHPPFTKEQFRQSSTTGDVTQGGNDGQLASATQAAPPTQQPGRTGNAPPAQPQQSGQPRLTPEGERVKGWLETIQGSTISRSDGNIRACNRLATNPDVSFESLKATVELLEAVKFVIDHDIAIDVQLLAGESAFNFEKNWLTVQRKKKRAGPGGADSAKEKPKSAYLI